MPITPQVGRDFETNSGLRATVLQKLPKPTIEGIAFVGVVKLNGDDQLGQWETTGVSPNPDYTLDSLWPADDSRQYQPVIKTPEGVYRAMGTYYAELGSLKHDWVPKGAEYALKLERDNQGMPTADIIDLTQL